MVNNLMVPAKSLPPPSPWVIGLNNKVFASKFDGFLELSGKNPGGEDSTPSSQRRKCWKDFDRDASGANFLMRLLYKFSACPLSSYRSDVHFGVVEPCSSNKCFTLYYFILYLVFILSTYISSSLIQLAIYNLFLRAIY